MQIKTTTTVVIVDELGRELVTVSRTERKNVGGNPRFLLDESVPTVTENAETVMVNAARSLDSIKANSNKGII